MRLIDADELLSDLIFPTEQFKSAFIELINDTPTVDAVPVKKGKWVGIDDYPHETWECDQCGCIYEEMPSWTPNFCPNCGARMDCSEEAET